MVWVVIVVGVEEMVGWEEDVVGGSEVVFVGVLEGSGECVGSVVVEGGAVEECVCEEVGGGTSVAREGGRVVCPDVKTAQIPARTGQVSKTQIKHLQLHLIGRDCLGEYNWHQQLDLHHCN